MREDGDQKERRRRKVGKEGGKEEGGVREGKTFFRADGISGNQVGTRGRGGERGGRSVPPHLPAQQRCEYTQEEECFSFEVGLLRGGDQVARDGWMEGGREGGVEKVKRGIRMTGWRRRRRRGGREGEREGGREGMNGTYL